MGSDTPLLRGLPAGDVATGGGDDPADGPIYIGGLDRCGKTTMSAYLTSHSRIAIPAVGSNMWTYFYGQYGDLEQPECFEACLDALLRYKHVRFLQPDPARIRAEFEAGPRTYGRLFSLFLVHFAEAAGKPRWGAQTGLIERYADRLFAAYPGLRIIHMIRDPRDRYLASLERWPDGKGRAGGATARWLYSTSLGERHASRHPGHYVIVRFEDLIARTEETLRAVCSFLGEDFEPGMLEMAGAGKHRDRLAEGSDGHSGGDLLSTDHIGQYRGRIGTGELAFMQLHAGRKMATYGYASDDLDQSVSDRLRFACRDWPSQAARMGAWRTVEALQQRWPAHIHRRPGRRMIVDPA